MMFLLSSLSGVLFLFLITGMIFPRINIVRSSVISVSLFFCLYTVVSSMFFLADNFRMLYVLLTCDVLLSGTAAFFYLVKKKKPEYDFDLKNVILPLIVCIAAVPFVLLKNQYFGMGQDQGVYQTAAVNYYYGLTSRIQTLDECSILEAEDADAYIAMVDTKLGGYDNDYQEFVTLDESPDTVPAYIHGIPVFAAMLALCAKISGLENMQDIQTVFYVCVIMLVIFSCQNMKLKKTAQLTAGLTVAFCSVVIWVAKSALTETFQLLLFSLFIYFLTDNDNRKRRWFAVFPVIAFSFYHVCIYTVIPVFVFIFTALYIFEKDRQFIYSAAVSVVSYLIGFFTMRAQQPMYTLRNYADLYRILKFLNTSNLHIAVAAGCTAVLVILAALCFVTEKKLSYTPEAILKYANEKKAFRIAVIAVLVIPVLLMAVRMISKSYSFDQVRNTSIAGFVFTTGAFVLPFAYAAVIAKPDTVTGSTERLMVFTLFSYCVLVYSAFLRTDIKHYYYYSRYIAPFIPSLAVFAALAADRFRWYVSAPFAAASVACVMPFDAFLMQNMDDTRVEWSIIEDYSQVFSEGDCVIIDDDMIQTSFFPVRNMNQASVFPVYRDLNEEVDYLSNHYDNIYYLTDDEDIIYDAAYDVVYQNVHYRSEDDLNNPGKIFPMSTAFCTESKEIRIVHFRTMKRECRISEVRSTDLEGFSVLEGDFRWIDSREASLMWDLDKNDCIMSVYQGSQVPFNAINIESISIDVYVNDNYAGTLKVDSDNADAVLQVKIPENIIEKGSNKITFRSELWNASDLGTGDTRKLGIALSSLRFDRQSAE